jgi:hypothetical protein
MATDVAKSAAGGNSLDFVTTFCHEMGHVVTRDVIPGPQTPYDVHTTGSRFRVWP